MAEIKELFTKCQRCLREMPSDCIYYKHPKYGIVCEYCPEFADGGMEVKDGKEY